MTTMRVSAIYIILLLVLTSSTQLVNEFKTKQLQYARVRTAYSEKGDLVDSLFRKHQISTPQIFIRAFKQEEVIELWGKDANQDSFVKLLAYEFCSSSGDLGPKRKQGDHQTPEGFYYIDRFNPWSNFYLSLGINYPNDSDRILGFKQDLGGDIFIHGDCVTIGCIPITDDKIKELYVFAVEAKDQGQDRIPVHIFPACLTDENLSQLKNQHSNMGDFWSNLKEGYDYFETNRNLPDVSVGTQGEYLFD